MIRRDDTGLELVLRQLTGRGAGGFEWYKDSCLLRRIEVRMRARRVETLSSYAALLENDPVELERLMHTLSVRVTGFFRNPDTWMALRTILEGLPATAERGLSAWSMGCATGEEVWSLAMLLRDLARPVGPEAMAQVSVLGSDVDAQALAAAESGRYPAPSAEAVRAVVREPYGVVRDGTFEVDPVLRERVVFRREDLTSPSTDPERFDLICCRNLLIFLGREGQRRVLDAACRALRLGGILALGRTESLVALPDSSLEPVDLMHRLYRRTL